MYWYFIKFTNIFICIKCIKILDLFPFEDDINIIKQKAIAIDGIDESLKKSIAELLYTIMKCIFHRQQYLKDQLSHGTPGAKTIYGDVNNIYKIITVIIIVVISLMLMIFFKTL